MTFARHALAGAVLLGCGTSSAPASTSASTASPTATSSSSSPADEAAAPAAGCPRVGPVEAAGRVAAAAVDEASGIVASVVNADVFWLHNDSGDTARAFAVSRTGALLATLVFDTAAPVDIEDIAIEDAAPGASFLYLGDIGDNASARKELTIHRVPEPKLKGAGVEQLSAASEKMRVAYVDGAHDAETLLFDPSTKDLLLVTKRLFGGAAVHRVGPFKAGATVTTEKIATVAFDFVTGGDISRDGSRIAIRNYSASAALWARAPGESIAAALARPACALPLGAEPQGEAFGFLASGAGYATIGEGKSSPLHVARFE
jgi:hypothetical protein